MDPRSQIWKKLDPSKREIRLFILKPNPDLEAVPEGRLETFSLNQHLHYEAISHAWGSVSHPELLKIENVLWPVTHSLYDALQRLRDAKVEKSFWVDALTIRQDDIEERAQQVQLMQDIFHRAANVLIWLGEKADDSVDELISDIKDKASSDRLFADFQPHHVFSQNTARMTRFARLDYWGRTWVIQEVALAQRVYFVYGSRTFSMRRLKALWDKFQEASMINPRFENYPQERRYINERLGPVIQSADLLKLVTVSSREENSEQLSLTLQRCRILQCSDPRDRIYGLLGIMTAMFGVDFMKADYQFSVANVYTDFAGRLITATASLSILNQAEYICNSTPGLPTWVPDWAACYNNVAAAGRARIARKRFSASGNRPWSPPAYQLSRRLILSGYIFSTVENIGGCVSTRAVWGRRGNIESTIAGWRRLHQGSDRDFLDTITMDYPDLTSLPDFYKALDTPPENKIEYHRLIERELYTAVRGRRFFVSSSDIPGLGPMDTQPGDVLAILAGGRVPYILRLVQKATGDDTDVYAFVGEAYVQGVMHGELLRGSKAIHFEDICLE